jgi:hypothetical protein
MVDVLEHGNVMDPVGIADSGSSSTHRWPVCGSRLPKDEIVFACQIIVIYVVIALSLVNLTLYRNEADSKQLWTALLSSCLGYILPNPSIKRNHQDNSN